MKQKKTEAASVIAESLNITANYVRKVIRDKEKKKYNGRKPDIIRAAYSQYESGKKKLVKSIASLA